MHLKRFLMLRLCVSEVIEIFKMKERRAGWAGCWGGSDMLSGLDDSVIPQ